MQVQEIEPVIQESPVTKLGGVSGLMWDGFTRIYRPVERKPNPDWRAGRTASGSEM